MGLAHQHYNYYFDFGAMLFGLAQLNQWRGAGLVGAGPCVVGGGGRGSREHWVVLSGRRQVKL